MKQIDARSLIIGVFVTAAVATGIYFFVTADSSGEEDRPVIIVRGGSVELEQKVKDWKWDPADKKTVRPDHDKGANVVGYMVNLDPKNTGTVSSTCPLPVVGTTVDVGYMSEDEKLEHVIFTIVKNGKKDEPLITAPQDMTLKSKNVVTHGTPAKGAIVSMTVKYGTGTQTCTPTGPKFAGEIEVQPLR